MDEIADLLLIECIRKNIIDTTEKCEKIKEVIMRKKTRKIAFKVVVMFNIFTFNFLIYVDLFENGRKDSLIKSITDHNFLPKSFTDHNFLPSSSC